MLINSDTVLWRNNNLLTGVNFNVRVFRVINDRVMFVSRILIDDDFNVNDGDNFELYYVRSGRRDNIKNSILLYRFKNCKKVREWIPKPIASNNSEYNILEKYIECYCEVEKINNANPG